MNHPFHRSLAPSRFRTRAGWLSAYALACGYLEQSTGTKGDGVTLWMEHGVAHVRHIAPDGSRVVWECFHTVTDARRLFRSIARSI